MFVPFLTLCFIFKKSGGDMTMLQNQAKCSIRKT